jgi:hypothetical protein
VKEEWWEIKKGKRDSDLIEIMGRLNCCFQMCCGEAQISNKRADLLPFMGVAARCREFKRPLATLTAVEEGSRDGAKHPARGLQYNLDKAPPMIQILHAANESRSIGSS